MPAKPTIAVIGAGSLATTLAPALRDAGYRITDIVVRESGRSLQHARKLASRVGARTVVASELATAASVLWFCVPDREIRPAASAIAGAEQGSFRFAFHSSGALRSAELGALKKGVVAVASVHPLMTFVPGSSPALNGVPFALEGDRAAVNLARRIVRDLGGESFALSAKRKAAYHAWATMTSPLFVAFLVTVEDAAREAGIKPVNARRMSLPIIRQTLANYGRLGPTDSFSGPIIRGDTATVAKHLGVLKRAPSARDVYVALVRSALSKLPSKNIADLKRLFSKSNVS